MTKKEISTLQKIVNEYADIDNKMHKNEELLKKISAEQTSLMKRLEINERNEKELMETLVKKYPDINFADLIKYIQ